LPDSVALAVTTSPAERADTVLLQLVPFTVAAPTSLLFTKTSTEAPDTFVPLTDVAPAQIGEVIVGADELADTTTALEAALVQLPDAVALAVIEAPAGSAVIDLLHSPAFTVVVPAEPPSTKTSMVVPSASLLVPLTDVAPAHMGEVIVGAAVFAETTTAVDAALVHLPDAVALAVIEAPAGSAAMDLVHAPLLTVVVPFELPPTKTSMIVPFASVLVPSTDVAPSQIGELIVGAVVLERTVTEPEASLSQPPAAAAFAVMTLPAAREGEIDETVHVPPLTVVVPADTLLTNISMVVPSASVLVPLTAVAPSQIGEVIAGALGGVQQLTTVMF
jgi:hypothetical protein